VVAVLFHYISETAAASDRESHLLGQVDSSDAVDSWSASLWPQPQATGRFWPWLGSSSIARL